MFYLIFAGLGAVIGTTTGLILVRPLLLRSVLDTPNHRSSHLVPTPRGGGVGVLVGVAAGLLAGSSEVYHSRELFTFMLVLTLFAALGLVDDLVSLPVSVRLLGQVALGAGVAVAVRMTTQSDMPGFPGMLVAIGLGMTGIFYVNAANFMDGVNGISGLHGLVAGGYFSLVGFYGSSPALVLCGLVIAVAFAAFLPWNLLRPGLFLGDVGSYLLGASIWLMAAGAILHGTNVIAALAPLAMYSLDVVVTLGRRAIRRAKLIAPHREHTYQQIQQLTGSHAIAALACTTGTLACVFTGWLVLKGMPNVTGVLILIGIGLVYLGTPTMLRRRSVDKVPLVTRH